MSLSLKDLNRPGLTLVVLANAVAYYCVVVFAGDFSGLWDVLKGYETYAPVALIAIVVGVLNAQLSHETKARLVFWRWQYPLPGHFAFSELMSRDARIDPAILHQIQDPLPSNPIDQNRLWFRWYREFQDDPAVKQVHREYLFARDWTGLIALMIVSLGLLSFWQMELYRAGFYILCMLTQFLLVRRAARNHGERFVTTVLAIRSSI